jgi:hypothetical protein
MLAPSFDVSKPLHRAAWIFHDGRQHVAAGIWMLTMGIPSFTRARLVK